MTQICSYCGGHLAVVKVEGRPNESQLHCRDKSCGHEWIDQNPRRSGPGTQQVTFGAERIARIQEGRPSQGEDNCEAVSKIVLAWLGIGFRVGRACPEQGAKRDSVNEQGADFTMLPPCGHEREVQVSRLVEQGHYAALGREKPVIDEREHGTLVELIDETVRKKADRTPPADRARRILAIDGRRPSIGLNLFLANVKFVDMSEVFGWGGVLFVIDERNTRFLDREAWPECPFCPSDPLPSAPE